jgi:tRNA (guanine-N7-)-methyltransferase
MAIPSATSENEEDNPEGTEPEHTVSNKVFGNDMNEPNETEDARQQRVYKSKKKPLWWRQISRKATKGQRRVMNEMKAWFLPQIKYGDTLDWDTIMLRAYDEIWLELGFGQGENLLANCQRHANIAMIGAEVHQPGVGNVIRRLKEANENERFWNEYDVYASEKDPYYCDTTTSPLTLENITSQYNSYSNLRIHPGDGVKLLQHIPEKSLDRILLTFPDPFPTKRLEQWRLIQSGTLSELYRVLKSGGLFLLATDHVVYLDWCHEVFSQHKGFQVDCVPDRSLWLPAISKYEQKGWEEGRPTRMACWRANN